MDADSISPVPIWYLIAGVLLILGGAYFAAAETSLASVSRIRMLSLKDDGNPNAEKVLLLLDHFDKTLTTLLVGNNVMHIACSSVATVFASKLWGNLGVSISTFVVTFIVFIFAEMIPKAYAKDCCEAVSLIISPSVLFLSKILTPITILLNAVTDFIASVFPAKETEDVTVSEEELTDIIEHIDEKDEIDGDTTELLQSAIEFTETTSKEVMVSWENVVFLGDWMDENEIYQIIAENHFSRLPVLDRSGNVKGVLQIKKFLKAKIRGRKVLKSRSMLDPVYYLPSTLPIDDILPDLSRHHCHMAFVKGGNNTVIGIITVEDILEELVGEIYDEEEVKQ